MHDLRILITCGGGPGVWGLLHALRRLPGRRAHLIAADADPDATLGTALADEGLRLPRADQAEYATALRTACRRLRVDVLIPVIDAELETVAGLAAELGAAGTRVLLPPAAVVRRCADKWLTHEALAESGLLPRHRLVRTVEETAAAIRALGYPRVRLCARPTRGAGGRGFHLIDARGEDFEGRMHAKPGPPRMTAEDFVALRADGPREYPLILSEFVEGPELGHDVLAERGRVIARVTRRKGGSQLGGNWTRIDFDDDPRHEPWVARVAEGLELDGLVSIDAIEPAGDPRAAPRLLEVNARPGAYIGMSCTRLHLLAWGIDRLMGDEPIDDERYVAPRAGRCGSALRVLADVGLNDEGGFVLDPAPAGSEVEHADPVSCRAPG
ncbi:MAG: ATP-grasp domain-containing protein [Planctomycetia bacterium]|nr:MAG: ATP-grasp domain-containing protein [Planctomycetia bacterium]